MTDDLTRTIKIEEVEYPLENLSTEAKSLIMLIKEVDRMIEESSNLAAIFTRAKNSYVQGLKEEIIRNKGGF